MLDVSGATLAVEETTPSGSTPQASGVSIPSPVTTTRLIFGSLTTGIDRDPSAIFYRSHLSHFPQASQHPKAG